MPYSSDDILESKQSNTANKLDRIINAFSSLSTHIDIQFAIVRIGRKFSKLLLIFLVECKFFPIVYLKLLTFAGQLKGNGELMKILGFHFRIISLEREEIFPK